MKRYFALVFSALPFVFSNSADASNIYMLSGGFGTNDLTIAADLTARGHTVHIGVDYESFNGSIELGGYDTVYLQCNGNWSTGLRMPSAGQQQLVNWVNAGGRLVTSEWVIYYTFPGSKFDILAPIIPGAVTASYGSASETTYTQVWPHSVINAGLPTAFGIPLNNFTGTETFTLAKPGAFTYYNTGSAPGAMGLCGWGVGEGSVFSFTSTCGPDQVLEANFGRLFSNVMSATAPVPTQPCYANCDGSTGNPSLTANDFQCFLNKYAASDSYANCDGSTATPTLTANDFQCFLNKYAAGCS